MTWVEPAQAYCDEREPSLQALVTRAQASFDALVGAWLR